MSDNRANVFGTVISGGFALLSKVASNFEAHAAAYAAAAAVLASLMTVANIIVGWQRRRARRAQDSDSTL